VVENLSNLKIGLASSVRISFSIALAESYLLALFEGLD
jgi:hypothetical protein